MLKIKKIKTISLVNVLSYEYIEIIKEKILEVFDYQILDKNIVITTPAVSTHAGGSSWSYDRN